MKESRENRQGLDFDKDALFPASFSGLFLLDFSIFLSFSFFSQQFAQVNGVGEEDRVKSRVKTDGRRDRESHMKDEEEQKDRTLAQIKFHPR
jgi:hypothetical protein